MREFLKGLDLDKETIDTIMAEYGKNVTEDKEKIQELEGKVKDYETKITELSEKAEDNQKISDELNALKQDIADKEAKAKEEEQDKILTNNILEAIGDKKFINEYTKNSIINEVKTALKDDKNTGKSAKDLFESITEGKTDIFENPNKINDMPNVNQNDLDGKTLNEVDEGIKLNPIFRKF